MSFLLRCLRDVRRSSGDPDLLPPAPGNWDSGEAEAGSQSSGHGASVEAQRHLNLLGSAASVKDSLHTSERPKGWKAKCTHL